MSDNKQSKPVLGIRREDKNRWERRAPLGPSHVKRLVEKGIRVIVQPSNLRNHPDHAFQKAGAEINEDLSEAGTIIAVKEVPPALLLPDKTYMFFSHTIKAQAKNMAMLDDILEKNIRLIDYEAITDDKGSRLVRFGKFAGYAGTIDTLHALGDRLLALGHSTPFLHVGLSYCYSSVEMAKSAVSAMGEEIANYGLPQAMVPFTFLITSEAGAVSQGSQEILKLLPHKIINQKELQELHEHPELASPFCIYLLVTTVEDWSEHNNPEITKVDKKHYYAHPEEYHNTFYEKFAPYVKVILNCMYWDQKYPRLLSIEQLENLTESRKNNIVAVGDISCDPLGSIEALMKTTSIDVPCFIFNPHSGEVHDLNTDTNWIYKTGVLFCAVDNFPTEFPKEATEWFGDNLIPFMEDIVKSDFSKPYDQMDLPPAIKKAVITVGGKLAPNYEYITEMRKHNEKGLKSFLILGAGFVSNSAVNYLCRNTSNNITIADIFIESAEKAAKGKKQCSATILDVNNEAALDKLVAAHGIVISLLPATLHTGVAKSCLRVGRSLVTTSYISPEMQSFNDEAVKKGIIFLNETGLDPGIDHMEAKRVIEEVTAAGGIIRSFVSWCGGLPLPEASMNPFGYKFSWSPRGALSACTQPAKYKQEGHFHTLEGNDLFAHKQRVDIFPGFSLEGVPNRDSTKYIDLYGLNTNIKTFFRGTLRYTGFCDVMQGMVRLGFLDPSPVPYLDPKGDAISWNEAVRLLLHAKAHLTTSRTIKHILRPESGFPHKGFDDDQARKITSALKWLGMLSDQEVVKKGNWLDTVAEVMSKKMVFEDHEYDMIILHHIFGIEWPNGQLQTKTSTLVVHGNDKMTAMAKTVGMPAAIAAELILEGKIKKTGVIGPMDSDIYQPILKSLKTEGVLFVEREQKSQKVY
eukprot:TRINITY_DN2903_c0_g1_i1.p1 TRINITY_DN2903_c0_g1~~TRINITY_DN2903_c0_g1_i1.p1  ORF type:complete len:916 (+),score=299.80 TRINITY_DN2903_c0_g1_i1:95-2842(+)